MARIKLPASTVSNVSLHEALVQRKSNISSTSRTINKSHIATVLGEALLANKDGRRRYPSAGGSYPIETYLIALNINGIPSGIYHYHPTEHALEHLWDVPQDFEAGIFSPTTPDARAFVVFTSMWNRVSIRYGDFAYLHGILETGHMAQNILLAAAGIDLEACPLGGFSDRLVISSLDLDPELEQPVYVIAV